MFKMRLSSAIAFTVSAIIFSITLITFLAFSATSTFLIKKDKLQYLKNASREAIKNNVIFQDNQIHFKISNSGSSLSDELRLKDLSAVVLDKNLNVVAAYGIFDQLHDLNRLEISLNYDDIKNSINSGKTKYNRVEIKDFDSFYDIYTAPIQFSNQTVGAIQIAKLSNFTEKLIDLSNSVLLFILPLGVLLSWVLTILLTRRLLLPLIKFISRLNKIEANDLFLDLENNKNDLLEIQNLKEGFQEMLNRISEGIEKQKTFVTNASHELKTPLTKAIAELDLLMLSSSSNTKSYLPKINKAKQDLLILNNILDSLLILSKIESKKFIVKKKLNPISISSLITKSISNYQSETKKKKIKLEVICPVNAFILMSPDHFLIICNNLLSNCLKYTDNYGSIKLQVILNNNKVIFQIIDNGKGMKAFDLKHIFDRFYRGDNGNKNTKGFGIGMSIVKTICVAYGVKIEIFSQIDKGTRVKLVFSK